MWLRCRSSRLWEARLTLLFPASSHLDSLEYLCADKRGAQQSHQIGPTLCELTSLGIALLHHRTVSRSFSFIARIARGKHMSGLLIPFCSPLLVSCLSHRSRWLIGLYLSSFHSICFNSLYPHWKGEWRLFDYSACAECGNVERILSMPY